MLTDPKQPDPAPVPTYLLTPASGFIDPCLFNDFSNGRNVRAVRLGWSTYHPAVVGDGRRVVVKTDRASDTFRIDGDLPPGTPVLVWLGRNFRCAVEADLLAEHEREQAAAETRRAEAEERRRHRRENEKQAALRFNATIRLPVKWDVGIKAVRSGLSASSSGDGCKANTVFHIHLPKACRPAACTGSKMTTSVRARAAGLGFSPENRPAPVRARTPTCRKSPAKPVSTSPPGSKTDRAPATARRRFNRPRPADSENRPHSQNGKLDSHNFLAYNRDMNTPRH